MSGLRALAHPLRLRLLELFAESPRTTKQIAELLGEPPTRLYHHVNALERAGLLELRATRANRGAVEKWYSTTSTMMAGAAPRSTKGGARRATAGLALTIVEQARADVSHAMSSRRAERPLVMRIVAVGAKKRDEMAAHLRALVAELQREAARADKSRGTTPEASNPDTERWALTIAFAPIAPALDDSAPPRAKRRR